MFFLVPIHISLIPVFFTLLIIVSKKDICIKFHDSSPPLLFLEEYYCSLTDIKKENKEILVKHCNEGKDSSLPCRRSAVLVGVLNPSAQFTCHNIKVKEDQHLFGISEISLFSRIFSAFFSSIKAA